MAISTLGESGAGTLTNAGSGADETETVFTTPPTADFTWTVTVDFAWPEGMAVLVEQHRGRTDGKTTHRAPGSAYEGRITFNLGPNKAVYAISRGRTSGTKTFTYAYHAIGTKVA